MQTYMARRTKLHYFVKSFDSKSSVFRQTLSSKFFVRVSGLVVVQISCLSIGNIGIGAVVVVGVVSPQTLCNKVCYWCVAFFQHFLFA